MAENGVQTPNLTSVTSADEFIVNKDGWTARISFERVASQVRASFGPSYETKAELDADLDWAAGTLGVVWNDATAANNGDYVKSGASGAGSWAKVGASAVSLAVAKAEAWAEQDEDVEVETGQYSAKHHAAKAAADEALAGISAADAATDASLASTAASQAALAALAAGAPLFDSTAAGLAATVSGDVFLVTVEPGTAVYRNDSGSETLLGWLGEVLFENVTVLLASTLTGFTPGQIIRTREESFAFKVAVTGVTDYHVAMAGGVLLYVLPVLGGFNIRAFGAVGDCDMQTLTGTDDTAAIKAAIKAAHDHFKMTNAAANTVTARAVIDVPWGNYRVTGDLFADMAEESGVPPSYAFRGIGKGRGYGGGSEGPGGSAFVLTNASATMFVNQYKAAWLSTEGMQFYGVSGSKFWDGPTGNSVQSFNWWNCGFYGFSDLFNIGFNTGNSEWSFFGCKFGGFDGVAFALSNPQSVNWRFFGCDAETFTGVLFDYYSGANIYWAGGSIIPYTAAGRIVRVPATAVSNLFGGGNAPQLHMVNTRIELRDGSKLFEKVNSAVGFVAKFDGCGLGGQNVPAGELVCQWAGNGRVSFADCRNMVGVRWDYTVVGSTNHRLRIDIDRCDITDDFLEGSTWVYTGVSNSDRVLPRVRVRGVGTSLDGDYSVGDASGPRDQTETAWHAIAFSDTNNAIVLAAWDGSTPIVRTVKLPPTVLRGVVISPVLNATYGAATATVTIKDSGGTTLATKTWTQNAATAPEMFLTNKMLTLADRTITVEITTSWPTALTYIPRGEIHFIY